MKPKDTLKPPTLDIERLLGSVEAYIVGGTVRDLLLGREGADMDVAVPGDAAEAAGRIAAATGGTRFALDEARRVYRVAVKGEEPYHVDVSTITGGILEDLAGRDFTINAMAMALCPEPPAPLPTLTRRVAPPSPARGEGNKVFAIEGEGRNRSAPLSGLKVIDPFGGRADLGAGLIRAVSERAFPDDPLRLLRAFRLAAQLGFAVEDGTLDMIKRHAALIRGVSAERVRDELYVILSGGSAAAVFGRLWDAGLLAEVLPELRAMEGLPQGEPHQYDLLRHSMKAMGHTEAVLNEPERSFGPHWREVAGYMAGEADGGLTMAGLAKLCALLHDSGKPSTFKEEGGRVRFIGHDEEGAAINAACAARLRLSNRAAQALIASARRHMRPLHLSQRPLTGRAVHRLVRDAGEDLPLLLAVALGDAYATREAPGTQATDVEAVVREVLNYYHGEYKRAKEEPLIRGRDLIEEFGLEPGPAFGRILREVEEMRADGALGCRADAIEYVRGKLL